MIQDHPLKVYYPHGGKHFIAIWWTHDEQNQIVVAKSMSALEKTLNIAIQKNYDFEIKEMFEIDIVSPPDSLCALAKKKARENEVQSFFQRVVFEIKDLNENNIQIPEIFGICNRWKSNRKGLLKKDDPKHFECKNCNDGILLKTLSLEEFYEKYYAGWDDLLNVPKQMAYKDEKALYSRADTATSGLQLWCVEPRFGHHFSGILICTTDQNISPDSYIGTDSVLFYFHKYKEIDNSKYKQIIKEIKDKREEKEKLSLVRFQKNRKKEKEKQIQKILNYFV